MAQQERLGAFGSDQVIYQPIHLRGVVLFLCCFALPWLQGIRVQNPLREKFREARHALARVTEIHPACTVAIQEIGQGFLTLIRRRGNFEVEGLKLLFLSCC